MLGPILLFFLYIQRLKVPTAAPLNRSPQDGQEVYKWVKNLLVSMFKQDNWEMSS